MIIVKFHDFTFLLRINTTKYTFNQRNLKRIALFFIAPLFFYCFIMYTLGKKILQHPLSKQFSNLSNTTRNIDDPVDCFKEYLSVIIFYCISGPFEGWNQFRFFLILHVGEISLNRLNPNFSNLVNVLDLNC